jgi:hypothetical protein
MIVFLKFSSSFLAKSVVDVIGQLYRSGHPLSPDPSYSVGQQSVGKYPPIKDMAPLAEALAP